MVATDIQQRPRLFTVPPFNRASMASPSWLRERLFRFFRSRKARVTEPSGPRAAGQHPEEDASAHSPDPRGHWHRAAALRRAILAALVLTQTVVATDFMTRVLPYQGRQPLEIVILILFAILFGWISFRSSVCGRPPPGTALP